MAKILVRSQQQAVYNIGGSGTTTNAYVLRPVRYTTMNGDDIVNYCAANSTVPKSYIQASMVAIAQCINNFLINGHSISVPDLGIFFLSSNGVSETDASKAGAVQLEKLNIRFRPCTKLKQAIDSVELECEGVFDIAGETPLPSGKTEKYYKKVHDGASGDTYTLTVQSEDTSKGTVSGGGTYEEGDSPTFTAEANVGYTFEGWYKDGVKISSANPGTLDMPAQNVTVVAKFVTAETCSISVESANSSWGLVQIDDNEPADHDAETVNKGTTHTIRAIATSGHYFVEWSDHNSDNPRTVTLTASQNFEASFEQS